MAVLEAELRPGRPYTYVGPARIREAARTQPRGTPLTDNAALREWLLR